MEDSLSPRRQTGARLKGENWHNWAPRCMNAPPLILTKCEFKMKKWTLRVAFCIVQPGRARWPVWPQSSALCTTRWSRCCGRGKDKMGTVPSTQGLLTSLGEPLRSLIKSTAGLCWLGAGQAINNWWRFGGRGGGLGQRLAFLPGESPADLRGQDLN